MASNIVTVGSTQEFLVDQFLLEVGEGRMPKEGSPERKAYEDWREAQEVRERRYELIAQGILSRIRVGIAQV